MCRFRHNLMKRRIGRRLPFRIMLPVSRLQLRKPIAQTLQIRFRPPLRPSAAAPPNLQANPPHCGGNPIPRRPYRACRPPPPNRVAKPDSPARKHNVHPPAAHKASRAPTKSAKPPSTTGATHRTLQPTAVQEAASGPPDKYSAKSVPQEYRQSVYRHTVCRPFFLSASHPPPLMAARQIFQTA